jgi:hypothetical protein
MMVSTASPHPHPQIRSSSRPTQQATQSATQPRPAVDRDRTAQAYLPQLSIRGSRPAACIESQSRPIISFTKSGTLVVSQPTSVQNQTTPGRQTRTSKRVRARRHGEGFHSLVIDSSCCAFEGQAKPIPTVAHL